MSKIIIPFLFILSLFSYGQEKNNDSINRIIEKQIQEVITKYNGDPSYGAATILYYDAFQECLMEDAMD